MCEIETLNIPVFRREHGFGGYWLTEPKKTTTAKTPKQRQSRFLKARPDLKHSAIQRHVETHLFYLDTSRDKHIN